MENLKFSPLVDKLYLIITIPTAILVLSVATVSFIFAPVTLFLTLPITLFVGYFLVSPLLGYVELRESCLFIKYGLILKKEIPYKKIRAVEKERKFYSESMMSLKLAFDQVNVKYNSFDVTTVSVKDNDLFITKLKEQIKPR